MARSVLEIILSIKGDKARGELKKVDKSLEKVDKSARKSGEGFKKLNTDMLAMGAAVGAAIFGAKKLGDALWAMGKRGGAVQQTEQSWDFLLDKLEVTPDILDKMRTEVKGTVDDMTIMSSTMTLLAGTSDELGKALLEQSPQLLKIAKAANKLNPSLGTTAFMYESIATGVKRAQPLILDNLGLVIKVGAANEAMAKELGKTVEELTAEEKAMAILNDTMRAGNLLIEQVGGNVDAAGDAMARAEAASKNLGDQWSKFAAGPMAKVSTGLAHALEAANDHTVAYQALEMAIAQGIITQEEANEATRVGRGVTRDYAAVLEFIAQKTEEYNEEIERVTSGLEYSKEAQRDFNWALLDATEATEDAETATYNFATAIGEAYGGVDDLIGILDKQYISALQAATDGVFELERAKFLMAIATGKLTDAQKQENIKALTAIDRVETLTEAVNDGRVAQEDLAAAILNDGVVSLEEFNELMGITGETTDIAEKEVYGLIGTERELSDTQPSVQEALDSTSRRTEILTNALNDAKWESIYLRNALEAAAGNYSATFTTYFETRGLSPEKTTQQEQSRTEKTGTTDTGGAPPPDWKFHQGGEFTVPGGYPSDSYLAPLRLTSGEHVSVETRQQQRRGKGGNIYNRFGDVNQYYVQNSAEWAMYREIQQQTEFDDIDQVI